MSTEDYEYITAIDWGYSDINDAILRKMAEEVGDLEFLDIGCNVGALLQHKGRGQGVDKSAYLVARCIERGLNVTRACGEDLPFKRKQFPIVVLSCVLEQCEDWHQALREARRVGRAVIGINPYPGKGNWGHVGGWVKSVIDPMELISMGATVEPFDNERYFFRFGKERGNEKR